MAYTKEEYETMKPIVDKLAGIDAETAFELEEATQRWMEEACELYSLLSRRIRGKGVSAGELEHELHDTLWGLSGISRLVNEMLDDENK
jgi:hypothetical protein